MMTLSEPRKHLFHGPGRGEMGTPYYRRMKVIAVYSTNGGVGKTTTAVSLAWEASRNSRVLLWDLDPQGGATFVLNVKPKVKGGVTSLVSGKREPRRPFGPRHTSTSTYCPPMTATETSTSCSTPRRNRHTNSRASSSRSPYLRSACPRPSWSNGWAPREPRSQPSPRTPLPPAPTKTSGPQSPQQCISRCKPQSPPGRAIQRPADRPLAGQPLLLRSPVASAGTAVRSLFLAACSTSTGT